MHFFSRNKALIATSVAALGVLAACGDDVTVPPAVNPPVVISITPQNRAMNIGETVNFAVQISGGSETTPPTLASCTSDNSAVATASVQGSACRVTAVAAGNVNVTAAASTGQTAAAAITVNAAAAAISNLSVSPTSANLPVGQKLTIVPTVDRAASGNTVTYSFASSSSSIATVNATTGEVTAVAPGVATITVTATGSGAGYSNVTLTQGVTVTVVAAPSAVNSVTVTPSSLDLAVAGQGQITVTVNPASGAPASTITYTSVDPAVASVSSSGKVTGISQGNTTINVTVANAGSSTLAPYNNTFAVPVTVSAPAAVAIVAIRQGPHVSMDSSVQGVGLVVLPNLAAGSASDVLNTRDQIQVDFEVSPNGQRVDSVVIYVADNENGIGLQRAEGHIFTGPTNATSTPSVAINTAEFTINPATGVATPKFMNGIKYFYTIIYVRDLDGNPVAGQTVRHTTAYNFRNLDGWAISSTLPAQVEQGVAGGIRPNLNWYGGPTAGGHGTYTIYPVIYTPGRSVRTATTSMRALAGAADGAGPIAIGNGFPVCGSLTYTVGTNALPWTTTYGGTALPTSNALNCGGYEHGVYVDPTNAPAITAAIDNYNASYPTVSQPRGYRVSASVTQPTPIRLDYKGPSVAAPQVQGAEGFNWVNHAWNFKPSGTLVNDNGVGPIESSWAAFTTADGYTAAVQTGAELAETNQNCFGTGCDGYQARATAVDKLGNKSNSSTTASFGVDKTSPLLRLSSTTSTVDAFASAYEAQGTDMDSVSSAATWTYDAVIDLYGANVNAAGIKERYLSAAAGTNDSLRIESIDHRSGLSRAVVRSVVFHQGGTAGTGTTSSLSCSTTTGAFGAAFIDGWRPGPQVHVTCGENDPGYYTTTLYAVDRAGNVSGSTSAAPSATGGTNTAVPGSQNANLFYRRTLAVDPDQPQVTGVSPNNNYTGGSTQTWSLGSQDDLEVIDARLRIEYPNVSNGALSGGLAASPGLVWTYSLSNSILAAGYSAGVSSLATTSNKNFGYFQPIAQRWDNSIVNPQVSTLTQEKFILNVQETCLDVNEPIAGCTGAGDPIPDALVPYTKPSNLGVQVRDVFGSWIFNTGASATTGVSAEFVSPILPATVATPGGYGVTYTAIAPGCPQWGGPTGNPCVTGGVNFRADGKTGATYRFRMVQPLSVTLPVFSRVELYGLNGADEWVHLATCTTPSPIDPSGSSQACGGGTLAGTDNGLERYWVVSFTNVPSGFSQYRALGLNDGGYGLFSTRQP